MDRQAIGTIINAGVMTAFASAAIWRGFRRRRSLMSMGSWVGVAGTLLTGVALVAVGFAISIGVDRHAVWVGPPGSTTRATWAVVALAALIVGMLLSMLTLGWFGYADPSKQFPVVGALRTTAATATATATATAIEQQTGKLP